MDKFTAEFIKKACDQAGLEGVCIRDDYASTGCYAIGVNDTRITPTLRVMKVVAYEMAYISQDDEGFDPNELSLPENQQGCGIGAILY